jgi:hypothetical protein
LALSPQTLSGAQTFMFATWIGGELLGAKTAYARTEMTIRITTAMTIPISRRERRRGGGAEGAPPYGVAGEGRAAPGPPGAEEGIAEAGLNAVPQNWQNDASADTGAPQDGQFRDCTRLGGRRSYL